MAPLPLLRGISLQVLQLRIYIYIQKYSFDQMYLTNNKHFLGWFSALGGKCWDATG